MTSVAARPAHPAPAQKPRSKVVDYLTTTDHKKIGVMYLVFSFFSFIVGGVLALGIRTQLATPGGTIIKDPDTYNQLFTMHATAMLFFFIIPIWVGWGNYIVPLQIGALDMAYPRINALSFWLLPAGFVTVFAGYFVGGGPAAQGWTNYPPLSDARFATGHGTDLWILGLALVGISSTLGAINFLVTIFKMRAPGMTMFRMPVFTWNILVTSILTLLALPVLTSALAMLFLDRNYGASFFDPGTGGNAILWQNLFWFYSHPAVYIMILP
ncbi:MAG: cytochrome c oxidase subunit, partial [Frankiaceae bacterium]|nr:cytochrome c oxidase subunit [Frankiaceae bacterium]